MVGKYFLLTSAALGISLAAVNFAHADESGLSFWLPGEFGSFAAVPGVPGWSVSTFYYHPSAIGGGGKLFQQGGRIEAGLRGSGNLVGVGPGYTFETPVFGGQAAVSLLGLGGQSYGAVDATLTGPRGNTVSLARSESLTSVGDLIPLATLKWNQGVSNFMVYGTGDIPVGDYSTKRLVNLGLGHGAIDGGLGYTYLNPANKLEFSAVVGLTYNLINWHDQYQNGLDAHFDWGASYFLTKQLNVGLVGYVFQQATGDRGPGASLGAFESGVAGVGPQLNYFFPVTDKIQGYVNVKAYWEFAHENRPDGWNAWLTVAFSPAAPK